ncbi:MAG: transcriptional repressor LexA [Lentisphaeria bacterium]|nr:transcriptional repressor LexA [Lentisphaeria bacterium]
MKGLTDKQKQILDFIGQYGQEQGMAPTINEISEHFDVTAATAFAHVKALQKKGMLNRTSKARSISLPGAQHLHHFSMSLSIPVLGRISAGIPGETEEHIERYITLDPSMLSRRNLTGQPLFAVKVQGESMRDAGILDGDMLIAQKTDKVKLGDVVIACVDDAVTVKYIYLTDGKWELRPANPEFKSRFVDLDHLQIQGTVVGLMRQY